MGTKIATEWTNETKQVWVKWSIHERFWFTSIHFCYQFTIVTFKIFVLRMVRAFIRGLMCVSFEKKLAQIFLLNEQKNQYLLKHYKTFSRLNFWKTFQYFAKWYINQSILNFYVSFISLSTKYNYWFNIKLIIIWIELEVYDTWFKKLINL